MYRVLAFYFSTSFIVIRPCKLANSKTILGLYMNKRNSKYNNIRGIAVQTCYWATRNGRKSPWITWSWRCCLANCSVCLRRPAPRSSTDRFWLNSANYRWLYFVKIQLLLHKFRVTRQNVTLQMFYKWCHYKCCVIREVRHERQLTVKRFVHWVLFLVFFAILVGGAITSRLHCIWFVTFSGGLPVVNVNRQW